jgi:hypothetical protein
VRFEIKTYQREKVFYEAMWFDFNDLYEDTPIVRGYDVNMIIDKLLHITKDQSGCIEVYKFTYNKLGHRIQLHSRFKVFNELELFVE